MIRGQSGHRKKNAMTMFSRLVVSLVGLSNAGPVNAVIVDALMFASLTMMRKYLSFFLALD